MPPSSHNLEVAISFLHRCPSSQLFPARWDAAKNKHCPLVKWGTASSSDPAQLETWQSKWPYAYFCINLGASGLSVVDIDSKHGKDGHMTLLDHELEGRVLPATFVVATPSGNGEHHYFLGECKTTVGRVADGRVVGLGVGLDTRGVKGGMVPVPGSNARGKGAYAIKNDLPIEALPSWVSETLGEPTKRQDKDQVPLCELDLEHNVQRATEYLENHAPVATEGDGGEGTTVLVACRLHDFGISEQHALELMLDHWNEDKADPPWYADDLANKIGNAYRYAQNASGCATPDADFADIAATEETNRPTTGRYRPTTEGSSLPDNDWTPTVKAWPILTGAALPENIVRRFIRLATRNSEADPAAVLATFLVRFGCEVTGHISGQGPYMMVGDTKHSPRLFAAIVGDSSKSRKGTSAGPVKSLFTFGEFDGRTPAHYSPGPLSTGEGLIYAVRDQVTQWQIDKKTMGGQYITTDPGVTDKRLFVLDEEMAAALHCTKREGNTLSSILRGLWDSGDAEPLTKGNRIKTTGAHVCVVTHITNHELAGLLDNTQAFNGFGNRFLWVCAMRQGIKPFPTPMPEAEINAIRQELVKLIKAAQDSGEIRLEDPAKELWGEVYPNLTKDHPGLAGCIINRAEAQVPRIAMIYALLDGKAEIGRDHLQSALAFWEYCRLSALNVFGGRDFDPLAEKVIKALSGGERALTELHKDLGNHVTAEKLHSTLEKLVNGGRITWRSTNATGKTKNMFRICENRI